LQLDRFEEDFNISRVRLKPQPGSKIRLSSQRLNPQSTINNATGFSTNSGSFASTCAETTAPPRWMRQRRSPRFIRYR
jgi:hypothetical protein